MSAPSTFFSLLAVLCTGLVMLSCPAAWADDYDDVVHLMRNGRSAEALDRAQQFLVTRPRDPQMRFYKGMIERESGKLADAVASFLSLSQDFPELPEPHNNLAVLYAAQNDLDKARLALEAAVRNNPQFSTALENLGDVHLRLAAQAYVRARGADPSQTALGRKLDLLRALLNPSPPSGAR